MQAVAEPAPHLVEKGDLMGEFGIERRIGKVATGRNIEAVDPGKAVAGEADGDMAASSLPQNWRVAISAIGRRDRTAVP